MNQDGKSFLDSWMTDSSGSPPMEASLWVEPDSTPSEKLETVLDDIAKGKLPPPEISGDMRHAAIEQWLRWAQSDEKKVRRSWFYLTQERDKDRDAYVLSLWRSIADQHEPNRGVRDWLQDKGLPWGYYQRHFFGWFLSRFNLSAARSVYSRNFLWTWLHLIWAVLALLVAFFTLKSGIPRYGALGKWFLLFVAGSMAVGLVIHVASKAKLPLSAFFHSLTPRLGAGIGIGYLFLFSAPHLVQMLDASARDERYFWIACGALVASAFLYIYLHVSRRVYPPLRASRLASRSLSILLLAMGYSAIELLLAAPLLFSPDFICGVRPTTDCTPQPDPYRLALCAAIALNLGVILQLAWDEKPLTEPL